MKNILVTLIIIALVSFALAACDDAGSGRSYSGSQGGSQISYDNSEVIITGKAFFSPDCVDETGWNGCTAIVLFEVNGAYCVMAPPHPDYGTNAVNGLVRAVCDGRTGWFNVNGVERR